MRTILHLDMNSYFATAEQQANPWLRGRPVGIIKAEGRGCVIAASVEAKKFGVSTGCTAWEAKRLCPWITLVASDMDKYFALTQRLISLVKDYSPSVEIFSIDEMFADVTESQAKFCGGALEIALEMKQRIKQGLGEWMRCSVGISFSKLIAKLASEMQKPDGLTWLTLENYLEKTASVKVEEVCGIGRSRTALLHGLGVKTLGEARMRQLPRTVEDLVWLRVFEPVKEIEDLEPAKSVSRTYTTFKTVNSKYEVLKLVRNLVEEAAAKLREMGMGGRTVWLKLSGENEAFWVRRTINNPSDDPLVIYDILSGEFEKRPVSGVRFAGVGVGNLIFNYQLPIFKNRKELLGAVDKVNEKFGLFTVYPARLCGSELIRPEVTGFLGDKWYRFSVVK